jgi:cytochrome P450 family 9
MSFMSHELAVNPDLQKRLQDEIDTAILENNGKLTYECIQNMKYLDMVILGEYETVNLIPN